MSTAFEIDDGFERFHSGPNNGKINPGSQSNIRLALTKLGTVLSYDEFAHRLLCARGNLQAEYLDDVLLDRLWLDIDNQFRFRAPKEFFITVACDLARRNSFHPVRDYLGALEWDGTPRLDRWLTIYGDAPESEYTAAVGMLTLVAAVRRVRQPGVKFDEMLVLESPQGVAEKSSAIAALCPVQSWFSDDMPLNLPSKEVIERASGRWIIECAELDGMRRSEDSKLKAFLSRQTDMARMSYDRMVSERPRQFVMIGTTNQANYLRDHTGARRYWPVRIKRFDMESLKRDRDQLWAEASAREAAGQSIRLDKRLWKEAGQQQEDRRMVDPWEEVIEEAIGDKKGKIPTSKIWNLLAVEAGRQTQDQNARLGAVMARLGFERKKLRPGPTYHYARGTAEEQEVLIVLQM